MVSQLDNKGSYSNHFKFPQARCWPTNFICVYAFLHIQSHHISLFLYWVLCCRSPAAVTISTWTLAVLFHASTDQLSCMKVKDSVKSSLPSSEFRKISSFLAKIWKWFAIALCFFKSIIQGLSWWSPIQVISTPNLP